MARPIRTPMPDFVAWLVATRDVRRETALRYACAMGDLLKSGIDLNDWKAVDAYHDQLEPGPHRFFASAWNAWGQWRSKFGETYPIRDIRRQLGPGAVAPHDWDTAGFLWLCGRFQSLQPEALGELELSTHLAPTRWSPDGRERRTLYLPGGGRLDFSVDRNVPSYSVQRWVSYFKLLLPRLRAQKERKSPLRMFVTRTGSSVLSVTTWRYWRGLIIAHEEHYQAQSPGTRDAGLCCLWTPPSSKGDVDARIPSDQR